MGQFTIFHWVYMEHVLELMNHMLLFTQMFHEARERRNKTKNKNEQREL